MGRLFERPTFRQLRGRKFVTYREASAYEFRGRYGKGYLRFQRTTGQMDGLLKVTIEKSTNQILGCTILAVEAGEMIGTVQGIHGCGNACDQTS
jgi:pyruvate/2-oxoglutarate dehydrogenase complex dihydrolipoamide dehydrogenase (E3) component